MNVYELFERFFCTTLFFITVYYTMQMPALGEVIQHNVEKQINREKYNETMQELLITTGMKTQSEILYDIEPKRSPIYMNDQNQIILLSHLHPMNIMRLFQEALHI